MDQTLKKPYEISLWDDDLVFRVSYLDAENKEIGVKEYFGSLKDYEALPGTVKTNTTQYYKERKICTIGSNTMSSPTRVINGKLVTNVNGSSTFTFDIYSKYYDSDSGSFYDNPFIGLLVNERKLKLRYGKLGAPDCRWYDFVVKDVKENSDSKTFSYTCKDLFVNELSKTGFGIVLDPELENNMGNITYLAEKVLEESDWELADGSDIITQTKQEPLYAATLSQSITAKNMQNSSEEITIESGEIIYVFYSIIENQERYVQFLYNPDEYKVDDNYVIVNCPNYYIDNANLKADGLPIFIESVEISSEYRGDKLIRQAKTKFDPKIDKYVNVYKDASNNAVYGYVETEYITSTTVQDFMTNASGISSTSGWEAGGAFNSSSGSTSYGDLSLVGFPDLRDMDPRDWANVDQFRSFVRYYQDNTKSMLYNSGFNDHRSAINTLATDDKYVLRAKIHLATSLKDRDPNRPEGLALIQPTTMGTKIHVYIAEYVLQDGEYQFDTDKAYFRGSFVTDDAGDGWLYVGTEKKMYCKVTKSHKDLVNTKVGIFFDFPASGSDKKHYYIEEVQFFKYVEHDVKISDDPIEYAPAMVEPGGELFSEARKKYNFYNPHSTYESLEELQFLYSDYTEPSGYVLQYNDDQFEKVRSITAKESNRFNLIQDLCETFECWAKFTIDHDPMTGEILLDDNYRQRKWISFHQYIGQDNHVGFKYGINLKSIQRTLNSDGIVSKIIVKNNSNQFAKNGFCSIARAQENPCGENFVYDFSYYIQQGLIDFEEVNNDLYQGTEVLAGTAPANGYIGYYSKLKVLNDQYQSRIEEQVQLKLNIAKFESNYQVYKISVEEAEEEKAITEKEIKDLVGYDLATIANIHNTGKNLSGVTVSDKEKANIDSWWESDDFITKVNKIAQLNSRIAQHKLLRDQELTLDRNGFPNGGNLTQARADYEGIQAELDAITEQKKALNLAFYKKYSRFIQEGSWISEDYTDDNLYYIDAENTLHNSSQPKVTYTIQVLELSQIEGYENYRFALGDKTHIEDTEFFGWVWKNGIKTPYKEEIIVSEITVELDAPEKNTFKVQNFKTQFEDLFQRITATTQAVEYHTGEYSRAANIVESDGTISVNTLQNSFSNNELTLSNAKDQTVVWGANGITTTSSAKPNEVLRIISGGLFMSTDGGTSWTLGISGSGINANNITTGQINTESVNIVLGSFPSFHWDSKGISAFEFNYDEQTGQPSSFNISKYVRLDQYGLYGINGHEDFSPSGEDQIWEKAHFALTWKGFLLRNDYDGGYVTINSDEDIAVYGDNGKRRIWIGNLNEDRDDTPKFGLRISKNDGSVVMQTDDNGELWLENRLIVGTAKTSSVSIGYLEDVRPNSNAHEVIHAGKDKASFIVYEDGQMVATQARITGYIEAEGGLIGGMAVDSIKSAVGDMEAWTEAAKKLDIQSNLGYNFKVGTTGAPTPLVLEAVGEGITLGEEDQILWEISKNFETWVTIQQSTSKQLELNYDTFKDNCLNDTAYIKATLVGQPNYFAKTTIMSIADGEKGESAITLVITSSKGNYFKNGIGATTLTARLFQDGAEIDDIAPYQYTYIWTDGTDSWPGKTLDVSAENVNFSRTYVCNVSKGGS